MLLAFKRPPLVVTAVRADIGPVTSYIRATGRVTGLDDVRLGVALSGTIRTIPVAVGDHVSPGQELLQLDDKDAEQQLAADEIAVSSINANILHQERTLRDLHADYVAGAVSRMQVQQARENLSLLHLQRQRAEAQVNLTRARILQLTLRSPITGIVTDIAMRPGEVAIAGQPIITVSDSENLQVLASLEQDDVQDIRVNMPVQVLLDSGSERVLQERVLRIEPAIRKEGSSSYTSVWISLNSLAHRLRPNQQVDVRLEVGSHEPVLRLPLEVLTTSNGQTAVWTLNRDTLHLSPIKTGVIGDRFVEVISGVSLGETAVLAEGRTFKEGDYAREVKAP